jgi:hypothetical protein
MDASGAETVLLYCYLTHAIYIPPRKATHFLIRILDAIIFILGHAIILIIRDAVIIAVITPVNDVNPARAASERIRREQPARESGKSSQRVNPATASSE